MTPTTFAITASELAGTGQSTFVTDSGPSVNTFNAFGHCDQRLQHDQAGYLNPRQTPAEDEFGFGWRVVERLARHLWRWVPMIGRG